MRPYPLLSRPQQCEFLAFHGLHSETHTWGTYSHWSNKALYFMHWLISATDLFSSWKANDGKWVVCAFLIAINAWRLYAGLVSFTFPCGRTYLHKIFTLFMVHKVLAINWMSKTQVERIFMFGYQGPISETVSKCFTVWTFLSSKEIFLKFSFVWQSGFSQVMVIKTVQRKCLDQF